VLVVEDDAFIRMMAVDLIENAGFETVEAVDADRAIEILCVRKDIRIVFTDIDMPGSMDGMKLARAIRDRWPPIELDIRTYSSKIFGPAQTRSFSAEAVRLPGANQCVGRLRSRFLSRRLSSPKARSRRITSVALTQRQVAEPKVSPSSTIWSARLVA